MKEKNLATNNVIIISIYNKLTELDEITLFLYDVPPRRLDNYKDGSDFYNYLRTIRDSRSSHKESSLSLMYNIITSPVRYDPLYNRSILLLVRAWNCCSSDESWGRNRTKGSRRASEGSKERKGEQRTISQSPSWNIREEKERRKQTQYY